MKIIWIKVAQEQLNEIYEFLAQQSERAAADLFNDIIDETEKLCNFPEMAAFEPLFNKKPRIYRSLVVRHNYKVIYRIDTETDEIIVTSVWDCRSDPKMLKKRVTKQH